MFFSRAFLRLVCVTILFGVCSANISLDHVKFNIFDSNQTHSFEPLVSNSLKSTEFFLANKNIADIIANAEISPLSEQLASLTTAFKNLLNKDGVWMKSFVRIIANESRRDLAFDDVHWMQAAVTLIQGEVIHLTDTNDDDNVIQKRIANAISDLDRMIRIFAHQYSVFKKYPLIGAPVLVELALVIAIFTPIAKILIPLEVKNPQIACKTLDTLLDYQPRSLMARLEKIHSNNSQFISTLAAAQQISYNPINFNKSIVLECQKISKNQTFSPLANDSFWDEFGAQNEYYVPSNPGRPCLNAYTSYLRLRVEEMFPIQLLEQVCNNRKPYTPTGKSFPNTKFCIPE